MFSKIEVEREGMIGRILQKKKRWRIVRIYVGEGIEKTLRKQWMEEKEEGVITLIERDFNARTRREGRGVEVIEEGGWVEEEKSRRLKDV